MAEARNRSDTPEQYEETRDPKNPPNAVVQPEVGLAARSLFILPLVVLALVAGVLWIFYHGQPAQRRTAEDTGIRTEAVGTAGRETPGGHDTTPTFGRTESELKFRGATTKPRTNYNTLREVGN